MYAKVNELVKAVNGMDKVIKEYVDYIDHYFENLDVQEEINNKIDEMAEGGELAEFIAQYANLPCVHAYDTIADMASSENLVNGSFARAMSKTVAGTGDGAYYKIRETVEGDDPDGTNLVAITGTTLVAEIIPDYANIEALSAIGAVEDNLDDYISDNMINVKHEGAKGDGTTDDYTILQSLIVNNPHKTLYFPAGTYLISDTLHIQTGNEYQVNLKLDKNAIITSNQSIDYLLEVGTEQGGTDVYNRYAEGSIVSIDGGIFDCGDASSAIYISANQKQTKITNTVIFNLSQYGIYIDRGTNTSVSSDADIMNVSINGRGSEVGGIGIYAYGSDNKISHARINKCQTGVYDNGGGTYYFDVHVLYSYASSSVASNQYEATKGFVFASNNLAMCEECYADTMATGFEISEGMHLFLNNCNVYYYTGVSGAKANAIKVASANVNYKLCINNMEIACPNNSYGLDFDALWLNGKQQYVGERDYISINNMVLTNTGNLKKDDWITCRAFYVKDSIQLRDSWSINMTQNAWYPVAYIREGVSNFRLRMANDQLIEVTAKVGETCSISTRNIFSNAHENEYTVGLCDLAQESHRGNEYGAILAVKSSASNCYYNASLSDGLNDWNTQIFTRRNFMNTTPLSSPVVNASASFNPN